MPSNVPDGPVLLTEKQVAAFTGISVHTLRAGRYRKGFNVPPHTRINGCVFYDADALLDWVCDSLSRHQTATVLSAF